MKKLPRSVFRFAFVLRYGAFACVLLIILLSLLPAPEMPQTGIPKGVDHFVAYWATGGLMAIAFPGSVRQRLLMILGFIVLAGSMEVFQGLTSTRTTLLSDFVMSSGGAVTGVAMGAIMIRYIVSRISGSVDSPSHAGRSRNG